MIESGAKILCVVLLSSILTGCGGSGGGSDNASGSASRNASGSAPGSAPGGGSGGGSDTGSDTGSGDGKPAKGGPLTQFQWHLKNTGQSAFSAMNGLPGMDLNVDSLFHEGVVGTGVRVLVLDDGLEIAHEDLAANVEKSMLYNFDAAASDRLNPTPASPDNAHGTGVAGIVAAVADNGVGGRGVAPGVRLGGARFIGVESRISSARDEIEAYGGAPFSQTADIFNASYARSPTAPLEFMPETDLEALAIRRMEKLRDGKGAIFVQAAGNEYDKNNGDAAVCARSLKNGVSCSNANLDPSRTMPQTIVVGAINAFGVRSSYSTAGSNLLVSAFGGEFGGASGPAIVTTDLMGCDRGRSRSDPLRKPANAFDDPASETGKALNPACNYSSVFNGTSAATPMVSGVVALMLQANPQLTWRDVRHILMRTARKVDAQSKAVQVQLASGDTYTPQPVWTRNAAGLWFDNQYGFGLVDAEQAVRMARSYTSYLDGPMVDSGTALTYDSPDGAKGLTVPPGSASGVDVALPYLKTNITRIEALQLSVFLKGARMGDTAIEVISPAGTRSVLMNAYSLLSQESKDVNVFTLASNAFNDESATGVWKVRIIDTGSSQGAVPAQLTSALVRVFGH